MKQNETDIVHLNAIKSCFLEADEARCGKIEKSALIEAILETKMKFPQNFIFSLIEDLQEDPEDKSD